MAGQFGLALEDTWGTPKTVDTFVPVLSATPSINEGYLRPAGIRARRTQSPLQLGARTVGLTVVKELPNLSIADELSAMFGAGSNSSDTTTYTAGALGESATLQVGIEDAAGVVQPLTLFGAKVVSWELGCQIGQFAQLTTEWSAKDVTPHRSVTDASTTDESPTLSSASADFRAGDIGKPVSGTGIPTGATIIGVASDGSTATMSAAATATGSNVTVSIGIALASASYTAGLAPFTFVHGGLSIAGTEAASARQVTLRGNNGLKVDRHRLGSRFIRQQIEQTLRSYTGAFTGDFDDMTLYKLFDSATEVALVLDFDNGTESLTITANVQFTGDPPQLRSHGLEEQTLNFECVGDTDAETLSFALTNSETTS